jgi:hypothetical protein
MEVRLNRPANIGLDFSKQGQGYLSGTAVGQYFQNGIRAQNGDPDSVREIDILLNFNGDPVSKWVKKENMMGTWIGHELQHRGMEIVANIGAIQDRIPERSKFVFRDGNRAKKIVPEIDFNAYELDQAKGDYRASRDVNDSNLEHMLLYSTLTGGKLSPDEKDAWHERREKQLQKYRQIYFDIEGAARDYVLSYPVPPGSLAALRNELEGKAPDGYKLVIGKDLRGRPTYALQSENPASTVSTANSPVPPLAGVSGKPVNGVVKKSAPPITVGGWTLSDD